jgi:hypothetical protein
MGVDHKFWQIFSSYLQKYHMSLEKSAGEESRGEALKENVMEVLKNTHNPTGPTPTPWARVLFVYFQIFKTH